MTARIQEFAEEALRSTGLLKHVGDVHGRRPTEVVEKAVTLRRALATLQAHAQDAVMLGDREHDVHAARANGTASIGVLYGYGSRDEPLAADAEHLATEPAQVTRLIVTHPLGRGGTAHPVDYMNHRAGSVLDTASLLRC
ncbi:HAD hydrolase-like protein [Kineococcus sp. SYSU DK006]|uniref:HAD hydrolase-like protein n=1 Tax=Kineococcus sp. SYSU DK006 TaxID=3383127 RepID=UPI003D7D7894